MTEITADRRSPQRTVSELKPLVIGMCSARKSLTPSLTPTRIGGEGREFVRRWFAAAEICRDREVPRALYLGRSFRIVEKAAMRAGARLAVLSAGLGLLDAEHPIPSYDLTTSPYGSGGGRLPPSVTLDEWSSALAASPFAMDLKDNVTRYPVTLVALTSPYAPLFAALVKNLEADLLQRLRLFGLGIGKWLPSELRENVIPYDEGVVGLAGAGTRLDFASRALAFHLDGRTHWDLRGEFEEALNAPRTTSRSNCRTKVKDEEIIKAVREAPDGISVGSMARRLRAAGIACGTERLARLMGRVEKGYG